MANLNVHPAPGLGDLTQGFYVVPQNPIRMASEGISRVRTLGEFMSAAFAVPQNPVYDYATDNMRMLGQSPNLGALGCGSCGGSCGMNGLDFSNGVSGFTSSLMATAQEDSLGLGLPNWGYAAALAAGYMFLFGDAGGTGKSRVSRARRAYRSYAAA